MTGIPGIPYSLWPAGDRRLWEKIIAKRDLFEESSIEKMSPVTEREWRYFYGRWLGYAALFGEEVMSLSPGSRASRERVETYLDLLEDYYSETSLATAAHRLHLILRALSPEMDWVWLKRIDRRLAKSAVAQPKRQVLTPELYQAGVSTIQRAEKNFWSAGYVTKSGSILFRDGLMVSTMATAPMRRYPFSMLELSKHMKKQGGHWVISVPPELTKTSKAQRYELPERLSAFVDVFLERVRPAFTGADRHDCLWPDIGRPLGAQAIRERILKVTKAELGYPVTPHRFRDAAATFVCIADPVNVRSAKDLLGHTRFGTTEKYYIDAAQSRMAGKQLSAILASFAEHEGRGNCTPDAKIIQ